MTGIGGHRQAALPPGPPWPLELLADLHAGVLDEDVAAELRSRVQADPDARATLAALDTTREALAALPPLRMPDEVAARIDAALAAEAANRVSPPLDLRPAPPPDASVDQPTLQPSTSVVDIGAARQYRRSGRRRTGLIAGAGLLTAAAAAVGIFTVGGLTGDQTPGTPQAGASATLPGSDAAAPPLALTESNLASALDEAMGMNDYGPLGAAGRLPACFAANGVDPSARPLGAREVTLDRRPGVLLVLPTGTAARYRLIVVPPDCGPGNPGFLADTTVGR